ncbi:hypothetical protein [Pseudalkalibacillus decolorationis]|uniref:hypothetical protein n=1 Tax=Pseudalkalibacillus decolorationis TaxID=163879 RepID=UPI0021480A8D|nr:hypothetical protein [Pseudalkalibacillus decolorationis]
MDKIKLAVAMDYVTTHEDIDLKQLLSLLVSKEEALKILQYIKGEVEEYEYL